MTGVRPATPSIRMGEIAVASASDEDTVLRTLLGSCIGVALYDRQRGVAGLAHVEIDDPISIEETFSSSPPPVLRAAAADFVEEFAATPIESGQLSVTVNLVVRFAVRS